MYPRDLSDPVGLVLRMLRSGDWAAYSALGLAALQVAAKPVDRLLLARERRLLSEGGPLDQPVVLIVGLPRSGTTLAYQVIASAFACSFFDNFSALFSGSTIAATRAFGRQPRPKPNSFESFYGKTSGLSGANDAFHVWNRWLGDDHYLPAATVTSEAADDMRRFFGAWMRAFPGPVINKNNRNSLCMSAIAGALDSAFFVVIERDPVYVAQSLYQARVRIHGNPSVGWGLGTRRSAADPPGDAAGSVSGQVLEMVERMRSEIASVPAGRVVQVRYEDLCRQPHAQLRRIADAVEGHGAAALRRNEELYGTIPPQFPCKNRQELGDAVFVDIRERLSGYG